MLAGPSAAETEPRPHPSAGITRHTLSAYVRGLVEMASAIPDDLMVVRWFSSAGLTLKTRFTDRGLADLYASRLFPRNEPTLAKADLRVDVIEAEAIGAEPPRAWSDMGYPQKPFARRLRSDGLEVAYPYQERLWQVFDRGAAAAVQFTGRVEDLPVWDAGAPLRNPIHFASRTRGARLLHAAAVGVGEEGILLVGPGGAGKSGTTLACLANGLSTVGDDYLVVELGDPPIARPVYRMLKQDAAGLARAGIPSNWLEGMRLNWQGKVEFDPEDWFPGCIEPRIRLRGIVAPAVSRGTGSRLEPLPRGEAIDLIGRSTLAQLPGEAAEGIPFFAALTGRIPAFRLHLSESAPEISAAVKTLIARLR